MELKDKVVIVTGSAGGLGLAMVQAFAKEGARVVVCDIDVAAVNRAVDEINNSGATAIGIVCDVSKEEQVESMFTKIRDTWGRLDIAVLNAGILRDAYLIRMDRETGKLKGKMSLDKWQSVIDVNLTGVFLTGREAAGHMAELGNGGVIIPISSVARQGLPGQTNYSAAKAGVSAMTRLWADELSRYNIRVAGIAPGFIATKMVLQTMNQEALKKWEAKIPIGRLGKPEEIAATAVFIAQNDLITGVVLEATGGVKG